MTVLVVVALLLYALWKWLDDETLREAKEVNTAKELNQALLTLIDLRREKERLEEELGGPADDVVKRALRRRLNNLDRRIEQKQRFADACKDTLEAQRRSR